MSEISPPSEALRLAAIVESSDDAIISKDLNGIVTSWNRAAERVFGYTAAEMIGRSITTIVPHDRMDEEALVLRKIRSGGAVNHFETVRVHKDGSLVPISLTVSPIRAADGAIVGASKIARDISERRRAERALAEAEVRQHDLQQRLVALVGGSGALFEAPQVDAVLPATIELARSLVSADAYAIWRYEGPTHTWKVAAAADLSKEFIQRMIRFHQSETAAPLAFSDPVLIEDVSTHPMVDEQRNAYRPEGIESMLVVPLTVRGIPNGTLVFYYRRRHRFDTTEVQIAKAIGNMGAAALTTAELYDEQRRSREDATRAYRQANEANRAKDEFLATLSHELRTPLNAVLGWARMLSAGVIAPARIPRALEVIERNADAQLRLVEDMLDLSRIITGNLRLDMRPTRISKAVDAAIETVLPAAKAREIGIAVAADPRAVVLGDPARLQQVVWNLLANAVKFTPSGGQITVSSRMAGRTVEIEVSDSGEGIDAEILPFVFDRFRQGDSGSTRVHMGLGLGLAIVRHIVEMHGGRVSATSEGKNQGSTFTLVLPATTLDQPSAAPVFEDRRASSAAPRRPQMLAGVRALVIDDDADAREILTTLLQARGVLVHAASSVREGLDALEREVPDIVLSDLAMPEADGFDLIRSIRERPETSGGRIPAIAVTALARPEDSRRSLSSGFQVHLTKPIDPLALYSAIERLALSHDRRGAE
jgi:PAS domain S-box-containing protein